MAVGSTNSVCICSASVLHRTSTGNRYTLSQNFRSMVATMELSSSMLISDGGAGGGPGEGGCGGEGGGVVGGGVGGGDWYRMRSSAKC